jgi:hypothetical protein
MGRKAHEPARHVGAAGPHHAAPLRLRAEEPARYAGAAGPQAHKHKGPHLLCRSGLAGSKGCVGMYWGIEATRFGWKPKPRQNRYWGCQKHATKFLTAKCGRGGCVCPLSRVYCHAPQGAHTAAQSSTRPHFARSQVLPAFSRLLQIEFGSVSDLGSTDRGSKKRGAKSRRSVAKRTRRLPLQAPCNQRSLCGHGVLLNAKGRLLANALGPGDGPEARRMWAIE